MLTEEKYIESHINVKEGAAVFHRPNIYRDLPWCLFEVGHHTSVRVFSLQMVGQLVLPPSPVVAQAAAVPHTLAP